MTAMRAIAFAAVIALAACTPPQTSGPSSGKPGDATAAASNTRPASAPTPQQQAPSGKPDPAPDFAATQVTPQFLVGRWGDNGDCTKDIIFNADGTFHSYTGGNGRWQINGDTIVMSGPNGDFSLQMQMIDQNHLMLRNPDGSVGTSQRC